MCSLLLSILILILSKMHFHFDEFVTLVAYFYILYYLYCVRVVSDKKDLSYIFIIDADTAPDNNKVLISNFSQNIDKDCYLQSHDD